MTPQAALTLQGLQLFEMRTNALRQDLSTSQLSKSSPICARLWEILSSCLYLHIRKQVSLNAQSPLTKSLIPPAAKKIATSSFKQLLIICFFLEHQKNNVCLSLSIRQSKVLRDVITKIIQPTQMIQNVKRNDERHVPQHSCFGKMPDTPYRQHD